MAAPSPRTWFITGTSSGFGRVFTEAALERGDRVVATARNPATLDDLVAQYPDTLRAATTAQFPDLAGVLPGFGRQDPNPWGLGVELRGHKHPHWTGSANSPGTFGHFGRAGTFLWVDPAAGLAVAALTDLDFGPWAAAAWPVLSDAVLAAAR